ncbi:MAG: PLP-dependent transferase, partial [Planctomycetes bacterium]|nr:PLP-dependent transferase [Planctomycetota bacterium]
GFLAGHSAVLRVRYPGLPSDPGHALASRLWTGFGAVLSFELADAAAAERLLAGLRLIHPATSLGGVESTIERRAAHPGQEHIPPGLLRLSVGCEAGVDLEADLAQALSRA